MRTCLLQTHSRVNEDLFQVTLPNHAAYAGEHGYDMIQLHRTYEEVWWGIEDIILGLLPSYDRILSVGSDVIFTRTDIPVDWFDDGRHCVFVGEEGLNSAPVNFDLVLWTKAEGVRNVIDWLRAIRPQYENHCWGLQMGMALLTRMPEMSEAIKVYPPRMMQSAPYPGYPGEWRPGDFALHFVGMSNKDKLAGCKRFMETGEVIWGKAVGRNDSC